MPIENTFPIYLRLRMIHSVPNTPKIKKFLSLIKSLKKDVFGTTSLREIRILKTDSNEKANICNVQFQSAFTREDDSDPPSKGASPFSSMYRT